MAHFYRLLFIVSVFCLLLGGCALFKPPRPLTFEEQQAYMAKQQCMQEATNMNPEWPNSSNPYWTDYFVMCMNNLGVSDAALRRMWY